MRKLLLRSVAIAALSLAAAGAASAATNFVGPVQTYGCAAHSWANSLASSTGATACTQPAFTDISGSLATGQLPTIGAGTVIGNVTTSSAQAAASSSPVLGAAGTATGTLGFSGTTSGTVTVQPQAVAGTYNFNLPTTAGSAGQVLTSQGGASTAMTWTAVASAKFSTASKTTNYTIATTTDDATRFDNTAAGGGVTFTVPTSANTSAGDNWCFAEVANQTVTVAMNASQAVTMANVTGTTASATALQSGAVGSSICIYAVSSTSFYAWASEGAWTLN